MSMRKIAVLAISAVLISGGVTAAASASTTTPGRTIHGCVRTRTGALSVRLKSGAKCPRGTTALTWNTTGPAGPGGPAGTAALFGRSTNNASTGSGGATCTLGEILLTAGNTAPAGTLLADGQLLSISSNAALFALLGTTYGGNGTTTFAVPDLKKAAPDGLSYSICATAGIFP
jgi:hypothetical protein